MKFPYRSVALVVVVLGVLWGIRRMSAMIDSDTAVSSSQTNEMKEHVVRRQSFKVVITESGKLRAIKSWPITVEIPNQSLMITWLAAEGAVVKKGDKLAEVNSKDFNDQVTTLTAELDKQRSQLEVSKSALNIALSSGKSAIAAATTKLGEANVALRTYRDLEGPKKLNELDSSINESRVKLTAAIKAVAESRQKLDEQIFTEQDERKQLEKELAQAKETSDTANRILTAFNVQKKIFRQYEYPQQLESRKQAVNNAELELAKAEVSAQQEANQKAVEVRGVENQLITLKSQIDRFKEYIAKTIVTAPVDGLVIYGDANQAYSTDRSEIRVGTNWYGPNVLMTIPDLSAFEVDINIGEEYRGRVSEGMPIIATIEAVPGLTIQGSLKSISKLGKMRAYDYTGDGARVFITAVKLDSNDKRLVSGMTTRVEIVAERVENVLAVPIEAIFNEEGKPTCYIREKSGFQRRNVKVARRNASLVEITEGLEEGTVVSLIEPASKSTLSSTQPSKND